MKGVIRTSRVGSQNRLQIPQWVKNNIVYEHSAFGNSIEWHYDSVLEVGVAASERLENFTHIRRTQVINEGSNIRPPQALVDELEYFSENKRAAVYYSEMFTGNLVYFFSEARLFDEIDSNGGLIK